MARRDRWCWRLGAVAALALLVWAPASAEGPSQVRRVGHVLLVADGPEGALLEDLAEETRAILALLENRLGCAPRADVQLALIPTRSPLPAWLASLDRMAPDEASGFVVTSARVGAVRMGRASRYPFEGLRSVLAHELTHVALADTIGRNMPRWFDEGVATRMGRRWGLTELLTLAGEAWAGPVPSLADLDRRFAGPPGQAHRAYVHAFGFINWTLETYGDDVLRRLIDEARHRPFAAAWRGATGVSIAESEAAWRAAQGRWTRWFPWLTGGSVLWLAMSLLAFVAGLKALHRRRRDMAAIGEEPLDPSPASE